MSDFSDGYIYVDYSQLRNATDDMLTQTKAIATALDTLEMELNELKNSWIGDDKDVYDIKQKAWDAAVEAMGKLLTQDAKLLTSVSENYQHSEQKLAQAWDSVKIGR